MEDDIMENPDTIGTALTKDISAEEAKQAATAARAGGPERKPMELYHKLHLLMTFVTMVAAIATFVFFLRQVENLGKQTEKQTSLLSLQALQSFSTDLSNISVHFIQRPELRPFFYGGETSPDPNVQTSARALAELFLDVFELFFIDAPVTQYLPWAKKSSEERQKWENYMADMFERSSVMCPLLKETSNWYATGLLEFAVKPCSKRGIAMK
jgi:hypothetical protein